jgi:hypothetical protein
MYPPYPSLQWTIEQIPGNRYIFKADNAQVSDGRGKLVANLIPEFAEEDAIWELVPTEEDDAFAYVFLLSFFFYRLLISVFHLYSIVKLDRSAAWFVDSDEDHVPIEIRQFSGRNIDPEVFYIRRAAD